MADSPGALDSLSSSLGGGVPPTAEEAQRIADGKAAAAGGSAAVALVPWWGIDRARARDIENNDNNPRTPAYAAYGEAIAGAKGEKVTGAYLPPTLIPYAEMSTDEAFGGFADLTEAQRQQQADRDVAAGQIMKNAQDVYLDPYRWSPEDLASVGKEMVDVGLLDEVYNMGDFLGAWKKLVSDAIDYKAAKPDSLMTPLDMLDINYGATPGSAGRPGPKVETVISRSQDISTNEDARYMLGNMMATKLGRRPSAKEVDDFQAKLNSAQRANPRTTTTVSTPAALSASGNNESVSSSTGGANNAQIAEDYVVDDDPDSEYAKYQAATTYSNALFAALRSPV